MPDAISTPGMGALGIVKALQGNKPAQKKSKKKKKKASRSK
jgi:hypothetical protein